MDLLILAFIGGILTTFSPCVLPVLPVIVGSSLVEKQRIKILVICLSLGASVVIFTLLLKVSLLFINVPMLFWQIFAGGLIFLFGLSLTFPKLWDSISIKLNLNRWSGELLKKSGNSGSGIWREILIGIALGPVFSSCSPTYFVVLATVLPQNFYWGLLNLLIYAAGLSGSLYLLAIGGRELVKRLGWAINPEGLFRKILGLLLISVGIIVMFGIDRQLENFLLDRGLFNATVLETQLLQNR